MVLKPEGMYPEKLFHLHKLLIIAPLIFFFFNSIKRGLKFGVDWIILYTKISNWADYGSAAFDRYKTIPHYKTELLIRSWRDNFSDLQVRQDWSRALKIHPSGTQSSGCVQVLLPAPKSGQNQEWAAPVLCWSKSLISVAFPVSVPF